MRVRCRKCGAEWDVKGRIGVRDECPECAAYIHTCLYCRQYDPRLKDCRLGTTEPVRDRAGQNFCEEFEYGQAADEPPRHEPGSGGRGKDAEPKRSAADARKRFEQLFRDPDA